VNSTVKSIVVWACIIAFGMVLINLVTKSANLGGKTTEIGYSDLLDKIEAGQVQDATIQGTEVHSHMKGSKDEFHTTISGNTADNLAKELHAAKTHFDLKDPQSNYLVQALMSLGPFVLIIAVWFFFMRQMRPAVTRRCHSARAARACSPCSKRRLPSRMWPAWMRPRRS